jgi:uncharacterized protein (TIGR02453 family)
MSEDTGPKSGWGSLGTKEAHFSPAFFEFFRDLAKHNEREWFQANKKRYESAVQEPALRFIRDAATRLRSVAPRVVADPRLSGGSLARIYRDIRFTPDKSPYKTHVAIHLWHEKRRSGEHAAPGLYLYLEPGGSFAGAGIWHPDAPTLKKIRDRIVSKPEEWRAVRKEGLPIEGDSLKKMPPGYDPAGEFAVDLRRKDYLNTVAFRDSVVTSDGFLDEFLTAVRSMDPLNRFLARSLGLLW